MLDSSLDKAGDPPVVVISDRFWRNRLNSSPDAVGQLLRLNGQMATIIGITPKDFNGALSENPSELFVPITVPAALAPELANECLHQRNAREFLAMICLAPGVTMDSAEAALDSITRRLDGQDPTAPGRADNRSPRNVIWRGNHGADSSRFKARRDRVLCRPDGTHHDHRLHESGKHALARGANRRKELGYPSGHWRKPLSPDPADGK